MDKKYRKDRISIIIPSKNEGEGIRKVIQSVKKYSNDIIIVDGHSQDSTKKIALEEKVHFFLDNGKGRGDAVLQGIKNAKYDIIVLFDADGSPVASDISRLTLPIIQNKADIVIASRRTGGSFDFSISFMGILRTMGSDFLTYLINRHFQTNYSDILYSFRAIKKSVLINLDLTAIGFDLEQQMIIRCLKKGCRIVEIPSRENARGWGQSKLKTITGVKLLFLLMKELYF